VDYRKESYLLLSEKEIKFRRAWTSQLYTEHEDISWGYNVKLAKPIIEIFDSEQYWGRWHSKLRTINISAKLINEYSWNVVINVLKHEMAHQIVTEQFCGDARHDELFQSACQIIGVPHDFRSAGGDITRKISDLKEQKISPGKRRLLDKVNKLLSLAQSTNEHEAKLAMKKAQELIKKYNLKRVQNHETAKYVYKIINHKKKRIENFQRMICSILSDFFFVDIIYSYLYDSQTRDTHRVIELLGTLENVLMAEYVYFFLSNQLKLLWTYHQAKTGASFKVKRSYWIGILEGFKNKLEQMEKKEPDFKNYKKSEQKTISALVCAGDIMLTEFKRDRFPRLFRKRHQHPKIYRETYACGRKEGRNLNLHKGITRKDGNRGRLLPLS